MKTLFISHAPHEAHIGFAKSISARIIKLPFEKYISVAKTYPILGGYVYAFISLIYSFFIKVDEDILLVDGGSSLFTAFFLKKRYKNLKIVYLDADLLFHSLTKKKYSQGGKWKIILNSIDGIISVSEENRKYISKFLNAQTQICAPYPKNVHKKNIVRKNYGLYVGRLDPDKNFKRIVNFGLQCPYFEKFIIIGSGAMNSYAKNLAQKNNKLVYLGSQKNVEKYYNRCKFLIHIPDHDPHPTTTMEAALCGCFPIITKGVGTRYLFDKIFIINNPENFKKINNKINYINKNEKKAKVLLQNSVSLIPTKKDSLKSFKIAFHKIIKQL